MDTSSAKEKPMLAPALENRHLVSRLPDGSYIRTEWTYGYWSLPAQCAQAKEHRDAVRRYLIKFGFNRLPLYK